MRWEAWLGSGRDRVVAALLAIAAAVYLLPLRRLGFQINDDGWYLHPVQRMLEGELLYRDVWTFYAPFEHHLVATLFELTGPSIVAARSLWVVLLALAVALTWLAARRFASARLAWIAPVVFALVPGQWSKAFYGLCSAAFFVVLAAALDRPNARRFAVLGGVAGATLVSRQDIGLAQLGLGLALAVVVALAPDAAGTGWTTRGIASARRAAALLAGAALPVLPVAALYAVRGGFASLIDATLVAAFRQRDAWGFAGLERMLSPGSFLEVTEGPVVGAMLLLPALLAGVAGVLLLVRLLRRGFDAQTLLAASLTAYVAAGLLNTLFQLRLLRLLETGVPFYLLVVWVLARGEAALRSRRPLAGHAVVGLGALLGTLYVGSIVFVLPRVELSDDYTGSIRARRLTHPVKIWGETLYVDAPFAEEIRLVRHYLGERLAPDEPIFAAPVISGWYLVLEHPNPTSVVNIHFRRDQVMTEAQKNAEVRKLLASETRFAITSPAWLGWPEPPDALRRALYQHFHPVREAGSVVILARNRGPVDVGLMLLYRRVLRGRTAPGDFEALERIAGLRPDEPLPHSLLARMHASAGRGDAAVAELREAARLEPADPAPLLAAARVRIGQGRPRDARRALGEALAVQRLPWIEALLREIGGDPDSAAPDRAGSAETP